MKQALLLTAFFTSPFVLAKAEQSCRDVLACLKLSSSLSSKKYIFDDNIKGKVLFTENLTLNKDNIDSFLSKALFLSGYTRVPDKDGNWLVVDARDVRYLATPTYELTRDQIPDNYDYVTASYKFKNPYIVREAVKSFRPFLSRYGRIVDIKPSKTMVITDTGKNILRFEQLLARMDQPLTEKQIDKYEEELKEFKELEKVKAKNCSHVETEITELKELVRSIKT